MIAEAMTACGDKRYIAVMQNQSVRAHMNGIRHDMSQFYPLKAAFEQILGKRTYRKLKETATLSDWKVETKKLLKAIELSHIETVKVADAEF